MAERFYKTLFISQEFTSKNLSLCEFFAPLLRSGGLNTPNLVLKLIALITLLLFVYFLIKKVLFYSSLSAGLFSSLECFSFSVRIPDFFFMSPFLHKTISLKRQTEMDDVNTVYMPCYTVIKINTSFTGPLSYMP